MATMRERVEENLGRRRNQEIKDPKGGAGTKLAKAIKANAGSLSSVLRQMEADGLIERTGGERRTYSIRLINVDTDIPTPSTNGQQAVVEQSARESFIAKFNEVIGAGEALVDSLVTENDQLRKQLTKSEQKVGELQLEVAALKREAKDTRNSAQLISEIEKKLAELKG